jgi:thiol:disulfide interchange protein DsbD
VAVTRLGEEWPKEVAGLVVDRLGSQPIAHQVVLQPGGKAMSLMSGTETAAESTDGAGAPSLWLMLWFAFLGGLILNVMPCVLPVIALKVLGFLEQSRHEPGEVRRHGLIYGAGVLASFLVLAGMVLLVQAGGEAASWGMQFQNPVFLVAMTTLVALVALNLFGVFEVTLGGRTMGAAAQLAAKGGASGAFFNGVLATALATPCTAPFLGLALGFAFAQPPLVVVLMFLVVGLGLALPYVVISFAPGLARYLPKPGAWMERFKVAMGFPMAATAFWLLSLLGRHYGSAGVLWIGVYLVFVALAVWVWGQFVQKGVHHRTLSMSVSVVLLIVGYLFALERQLNWRDSASVVNRSNADLHSGGIAWEPWSAMAVAAAREEGRPVLVDFTAEWCFTCRLNKETSLEIEPVAGRMKELGAAAFLGDYTLKDPKITAELHRWGRAGVPLVLVYPADASEPPRVLPEFLTPGIVLDALEWAGDKTLSRADSR